MSERPPKAARGEAPTAAWDPLHDVLTLKERFNRLFDNVLRRGEFSGPELDVASWSPAVDLRENAEAFVLTAELPGVRREDLRVRFERGLLILEGERPMDTEARDADHLRVERSYGPFSRSFHLPAPIDDGRVTARFRLGVLEIVAPKSAEAGTHPLKIRVG